MRMATRARCSNCDYPLEPSHQGPCPRCGEIGKTVEVHVSEEVHLSSSLSWEKRAEFLQHRRLLSVTLWTITLGSPLLGFIVEGMPGVVVGLVIGVITQAIGPLAVTKVREITRGGDR